MILSASLYAIRNSSYAWSSDIPCLFNENSIIKAASENAFIYFWGYNNKLTTWQVAEISEASKTYSESLIAIYTVINVEATEKICSALLKIENSENNILYATAFL